MLSESFEKMRRRVLVVERTMENRTLFADLLGALGHIVRIAETGSEALGCVPHFLPDVVFTAIRLTDQSGFRLCATLRNMSETQDALIIAITGHVMPSCVRIANDAGFDMYLTKPVAIETLLEVLQLRRENGSLIKLEC